MNELAAKIIRGMTEPNSELEFRIQANTELYRKGFGRLWLKNPDGSLFDGRAEVRLKQTGHEYNFGANLFMLGEFPSAEQNARFEERFSGLFNLGVIPLYWRDLEPEPGKLRFDKNSPKIYRRPPTDLCVEFCEKNTIRMKGHPLCWNQWLPDWLPLDRREFMRLQEKRVAKIAERYADKIFIFDAINEVLSANTHVDTPYPEDVMEQAFRIAEKYFPQAQLILNEDVHWWKYQSVHSHFFMLVKELIAHGHRPGGLGFQFHSFPKYFDMRDYTGNTEADRFMNAENLYRMLDLYGKLDIPCSLTEISIMARKDMLGEEADEVQKIATERLYRLWFSHPATDGIVWWNAVDGTAAGCELGGNTSENAFRAGLFNFDFSFKPAGEAVRRLIKEEWHTETTICCEPGGDNRFHGFYGDYDVEIRTDTGIFHQKLCLSKFAPQNIVLVLK